MTLVFVEATRFTERIQELRAERELDELQTLLCRNPEFGDVVTSTGGFRKIRMRLPGRGKRGGCRVIYLYVADRARIYFVYLYPKNEEVNLSSDQKKQLKLLATEIYEEAKKSR